MRIDLSQQLSQFKAEVAAEVTERVVSELKQIINEQSQSVLVDGDKLAKRLGISRPTVDRLRAEGEIPSVQIGRRRLYRLDDVLEALKKGDTQ